MMTRSVLKLRWYRLVLSWFRHKSPQPVLRSPRLMLWEMESRTSPGNIANVLFGSLSLGYLLPDDATAVATNTDSLTIAPENDAGRSVSSYASMPSEDSEGHGRDNQPSRESADSWVLSEMDPFPEEGALGGMAGAAPGHPVSIGGGGMEASFSAGEASSTPAEGAGGYLLPAESNEAPATSGMSGGGSAGMQPPVVSPQISGAAADAGTSAMTSPLNVTKLGLLSHTPLSGHASHMSNFSSLAPQSHLASAIGGHGQRPANVFGSLDSSGANSNQLPGMSRTSSMNLTGVTGSLSPTNFLNANSRNSPIDLVQRFGAVQPKSTGLNLGLARTYEAGLHTSAAPTASVSRSGAVRPDFGGGFGFGGDDGGGSTGGGSSGGGTGGGSSGGGSGGGTGGGSETTTDNYTGWLHGAYSFTYDIHGTDSSGAYAIYASGTTGVDDEQTATPSLTGSVHITAQFHRGAGNVTSGDPSNTQTLSFDPSGSGLLLGFDIDGYAATQYGDTPAQASSYTLTITGNDSFEDHDIATDTRTDTTLAKTNGDNTHDNDYGNDTVTLTFTGTGASRSYTLDETSNISYNDSEDESENIQSSSETEVESDHTTDVGYENDTYHEQGSVAANGVLQMASFTFGVRGSDNETDIESGTDTTTGGSTDSENWGHNDTSNITENITITGSANSWTGTVNNFADDNPSMHDGGEDSVGGGNADDDVWYEFASGPMHETLHGTVTGNDTTATVQNLDWFDTGTLTVGGNDTDTSTITAGPDISHETITETGNGNDTATIHLGINGGSGTVTQTENIGENITDGNFGNDVYNDAYTFTDPTTGQSYSGTEFGSDYYNETDGGTEGANLTSGGTIDANGVFASTGFSGDMNGSVTGIGGDGGNDTISVTGETDHDHTTDTSNVGDIFGLHLSNTGSGPTIATMNATISGAFTNNDDLTDIWGIPGGFAENGSEEKDNSETDGASVTVKESGPLDSSSGITPTTSDVTISGTSTFSNPDNLTDNMNLAGATEHDQQNNTFGGNDTYNIRVIQAANGVKTLTDTENINETANIAGQLNQTGGSNTDVGSVTLSGPVNAKIVETGSMQNGQFQLDPSSGNDSVNLNGSLHNKTSSSGSGSFGRSIPIDMGGVILGNWNQQDPDSISPVSQKTTTQFDDDALKMKEDDTESLGVLAIGALTYQDKPKVVVTTIYTYDQESPYIWSPYDIEGTETTTVTESADESLGGSGNALTGSLTTIHEDTDNYNISWSTPYNEGTLTQTSSNKTTHILSGSDSPSLNASATDTTKKHSDLHTVSTDTNMDVGTPAILYSITLKVDMVDDLNTTEQLVAGQNSLTAATGSGSTTFTNTNWYSGALGFQYGSVIVNRGQTYSLGQGAVNTQFADDVWHIHYSGTSPYTGQDVTYNYDGPPQTTSSHVPPPPADWFATISNFSAGMGDAVSCGLTQKIRQGLGYDDVVDKSSGAYAGGSIAGEVVSTGLQFVTPCAAVGVARNALRGLHAVQAVSHTIDAGTAFGNGDMLGGLGSLTSAYLSTSTMLKSCFAAGTPLLTPDGEKRIEDFKPGDWILSAPEDDASAPAEAQQVEEVFTAEAELLELRVDGRRIRTTDEHPFFVQGKGWTSAKDLLAGDVLRSHDGQGVTVEGVRPLREIVPVYNLRISEYHTYFVGSRGWGFSVWAHNTCTVLKNYKTGKAAEKHLASLLTKQGFTVERNVFFNTPFGRRYLDLVVSKGSKVVGAIEVKTGNSVYHASQRAKDAWISLTQKLHIDLVRF